MDRNIPPPWDEPEPLDNRQPRASAENIELLYHPYYASRSPAPTLAYATHYSEEHESVTPTYVLADSQQQLHLEVPDKSQDPSTKKRNHKSHNHVLRQWMWEILSIAAAALALVAIVIILALHGERPLPKWPSAITINALIAVFTAILKACLIMPITECIGQLKWLWYQKSRPLGHIEQWDLASRGPWGSLLLTFVLKGRDLAVIGAILTIITMAVDPFTQQVVKFYSCSKMVEGERAKVPFSNNYTAGVHYDSMTGGGAVIPPHLGSQMLAAIYIGLLGPLANTSAAVKFECRTGNCTFPSIDGAAFQSLALESQCTDIGSDIVSFTSPRECESSQKSSCPLLYDEMTADAELAHYNLSLKNALNGAIMQSGSRLKSKTGRGPSHFLLNVSYLMSDRYYLAIPENSHAFDCEFYPAVQTYSATIKDGFLFEQVLNSQRMDVWASDDETHALLVVDRTIRQGKWHECTSSPTPTDEHNLPLEYYVNSVSVVGSLMGATSFSSEELASPPDNVTWWPQDCVYSLPYQITGHLSQAISSLLGNETVFDVGINYNPWLINIWNNGTPTTETVQAAMDGVTRSITARLREGDDFSNNSGPAYGQVWEMQTCVHINWGWLGLPAGLLLLTTVFLFLTIYKTRSKHARVWKSSIFAVLFNGLDQETQKAAGAVVSLEEMKAAADRATVRLEDTKDGFRLVSQA